MLVDYQGHLRPLEEDESVMDCYVMWNYYELATSAPRATNYISGSLVRTNMKVLLRIAWLTDSPRRAFHKGRPLE